MSRPSPRRSPQRQHPAVPPRRAGQPPRRSRTPRRGVLLLLIVVFLVLAGIGGGIVVVGIVMRGTNFTLPAMPTFPDRAPTPTPTPRPPPPTLSEVEAYALIPLAQEFTHPNARPVVSGTVNIHSLLIDPDRFAGHSVELEGRLAGLVSVHNLLPRGWETAYVLTLDDGSGQIPVLYRGYVGDLIVGEQIRVVGAFSAPAQGVHADVVLRPSQAPSHISKPPLALLIAGAIVAILGLFALGMLIARRPPLLLLALLLLTSCTMEVQTVIRENGSASLSLEITELVENTNFLRQAPGMNRYLTTWQTQLREAGVLIDNWTEGDTEHIFLQRYFADLASLSSDPQQLPSLDSWVWATSYEDGETTCFRYAARVNTATLYDVPPGTESAATDEFHRWLDAAAFRYTLILPGEIVYSNTSLAEGNRLTWIVQMNGSDDLVAESCLATSQAVPPPVDWSWGWWGVGGGVLVVTGLYILALLMPSYRQEVRNSQFYRRRR